MAYASFPVGRPDAPLLSAARLEPGKPWAAHCFRPLASKVSFSFSTTRRVRSTPPVNLPPNNGQRPFHSLAPLAGGQPVTVAGPGSRAYVTRACHVYLRVGLRRCTYYVHTCGYTCVASTATLSSSEQTALFPTWNCKPVRPRSMLQFQKQPRLCLWFSDNLWGVSLVLHIYVLYSRINTAMLDDNTLRHTNQVDASNNNQRTCLCPSACNTTGTDIFVFWFFRTGT